MLQSVEIRDCMQHKPPHVSADSNVYDAINQILTHQVSGLCVVDEHGNLVGVLSEVDCLRAILSATYNETEAGSVREYMTTQVEVADGSEDIIDVASRMLKHHRRRIPVVEGNRLVGQITCRQVLNAVKGFVARQHAPDDTPIERPAVPPPTK